MYKPTRWLLATMLLIGLTACQNVRIEDDPAEQAKATAVAEKYVKAFAAHDGTLVMEMSTLPFWGDGEAFPDKAALQAALADQLNDDADYAFELKSARYLPPAEWAKDYPKLFQQLQAAGMTQNLHAVELQVVIDGQPDTGVVLVRRNEQGLWTVAGIGD